MCNALAAEGVETLIATTDADGAGRLDVPKRAITSFNGIPTIFFPGYPSAGFGYAPGLARWLSSGVRRADVVHIHGVFAHSSLAAAAACRRAGIPYIVRPFGSLDPWSLSRRRMEKRLLWWLGVRQMLDGAAAVHFTSVGEQRAAGRLLRVNLGKVVPLGVDEPLDDIHSLSEGFQHKSRGPYVIALSRIHPKKGLELLIAAFVEATSRPGLGHWRLVIAGDGDSTYLAELQRHVARLQAKNRVTFPGWLDEAPKWSALQGAALFALPSYQENFCLAAVEAMACGVPVLVSDRMDLADEIQTAGAGWVTLLSSHAMAQKLAAALSSADDRATRGAAGRQLVLARYTWPKVAAQLLALYGVAVGSTA